VVGDGDLDYSRLLGVLESKGYDGLAILEIPGGEQVFDNFRESVDYLQRLMGRI
jgi:sugar phosphate isomerase/epimerase